MLILLITFLTFFTDKKIILSTKTNTSIKVDALEDNEWKKLPYNNGFTQLFPNPMKNSTLKTEFKFTYNESFLFFYIRSEQNEETIITKHAKHDLGTHNTDWVLISIDPFKNGSIGYSFAVTPSGSQWDAKLLNNGEHQNSNWNAVWESSTRIEKDHWVTELKIPLREINFPTKEIQDWGVQIYRNIHSLQEQSAWEMVDPNIGIKLDRFGTLKNLKNLTSNTSATVLPSIISNFNNESDYNPLKTQRTVGIDLKYKPDESHSLLLTFQPDFAQIEVDRDQINLTNYPLFLQEKRPFFLNGNSLFDMSSNVYYSRRITRPRAGIQFHGQSKGLKYGTLIINNDGLNNNKRTNENFLLSRIKYEKNHKFSLGYYLGYVNSAKNLSGEIHSFDIRKQISDQINTNAYYATSRNTIKDVKNHKLGFQTSYSSEYFFLGFTGYEVSKYFKQDLTGFPSPTNEELVAIHFDYRFKFTDSFIRQIEVHNKYQYHALENRKLPSNRYEIFIKNSFHSKTYGQLQLNFGFTKYKRFFRDYSLFDNNKTIFTDNYGAFTGEKTSGGSEFISLQTDFSKKIAVYVDVNRYDFYQSSIHGLHTNIQLRPTNELTLQFKIDHQNIDGSEFIGKGEINAYSIKAEYAVQHNLFTKLFAQYNDQSETVGINFIATYEYIKGSYLYLAYTEVADSKNNLQQYILRDRKVSLKWTYALFL